MTQGRATYTMQFGAYEPVPKNIFDELTARNGDGEEKKRA
jgi:elongation factor G